jgi:hypothetical protein
MKLNEHLVLAALLVPTAALATSVLITFAAPHEMPAQASIYTTSPAPRISSSSLRCHSLAPGQAGR